MIHSSELIRKWNPSLLVRFSSARSFGILGSEMPHGGKQFVTRAPINAGGPANEVWARPKEREHSAVSPRPRLNSSIHPPAVGGAWEQCCRGRGDPIYLLPVLLRQLLAGGPCFESTEQLLWRRFSLHRWRLADLNGPNRPADGQEILRILDFLMTQKLGPGAIRGIAKVMR